MDDVAVMNPSRRKFLHAAPVAAVAGLALTDVSMFSAPAAAQGAAEGSFKYEEVSAKDLHADIQGLGSQGNKNLVTAKTMLMILTVETAKNAPEFEWHEARDHVFQILDGSTEIIVGGTPKGGHSIGPGEWKAPESEGAVSYKLSKGDYLVIPRNTPHKRNTTGTVTLLLISPQGV